MRLSSSDITRLQSSSGMTGLLLALASKLFETVVWLRNEAFDRGVLSQQKSSLPVISVGNLTTGGTGKTAVVRFLAEALAPARVGILTRGYGNLLSREPHRVSASDPASLVGDEPALLKRWLPEAAIVVSGSRAKAAASIVGAVDVVILDDGFQHRWLERDVDVVVVSPGLPPPLLPAGMSREPVSALARADVLWLHEDGSGEGDRHWLDHWRHKPTIVSRYKAAALRPVRDYFDMGTEASAERREAGADCSGLLQAARKGLRVHVLTALARGERVCTLLRMLGTEVCGATHLPDHSPMTMASLRQAALDRHRGGADYTVITEKDAIKLKALLESDGIENVLVLEVELEIVSGRASILNSISSCRSVL